MIQVVFPPRGTQFFATLLPTERATFLFQIILVYNFSRFLFLQGAFLITLARVYAQQRRSANFIITNIAYVTLQAPHRRSMQTRTDVIKRTTLHLTLDHLQRRISTIHSSSSNHNIGYSR